MVTHSLKSFSFLLFMVHGLTVFWAAAPGLVAELPI